MIIWRPHSFPKTKPFGQINGSGIFQAASPNRFKAVLQAIIDQSHTGNVGQTFSPVFFPVFNTKFQHVVMQIDSNGCGDRFFLHYNYLAKIMVMIAMLYAQTAATYSTFVDGNSTVRKIPAPLSWLQRLASRMTVLSSRLPQTQDLEF